MTPLSHRLAIILICLCLRTGLAAQQPVPSTAQHQNDLTNAIKTINDPAKAAVYADSLLRIARQRRDGAWEAEIELAMAYKSYQAGDRAEALRYGRQSFAHAAVRDSVTYVKAGLMVAYMLNYQGAADQGLKMAFRMLRTADSRNWTKMEVDARLCVADIYRSLDQPAKALPYAQEAAVAALSARDTASYIFALSTVSNIHSHRGMSNAANLQKATRSMEVILNPPFASFLSPFERSRYLSNLGRLYEMQNRFQAAEKVLLESVSLTAKHNFPAIQKHALNELMTLKISTGKYREAVGYGLQALGLLSRGQSSQTLQRNIYRRLSEAYLAMGDYKNAYGYTQKANAIHDSLTSVEKTRAANELDARFRADKKVLEANNRSLLLRHERNLTIFAAVTVLMVVFTVYGLFLYRRRKQAAILALENEQLARLDRLKSMFFTNISHELRTPLTLIMSPAEQLRREGSGMSTDERANAAELIWRNSRKLLDVINELLDLSKLETGKLRLRNEPLNLHAFIGLTFGNFSSAARYKRMNYVLDKSIPETLWVIADRDKLEKVMNNLLSNAIKFSPAGGSVRMSAVVDSGELKISVQDTGPGIHPDEQGKVFDRFYQVDRPDAAGGTGIGLAIVKEFSELMGGSLELHSEAGQGTEFRLSLPLVIAEAPVSTAAQPAAPLPADMPLPAGQDRKILLVEDQADMSAYVKQVLDSHYEVVQAIDGEDALSRLAGMPEPPDLILSDVMMTGMDGYSLLQRLKADPVYCHIPFVMLTAQADVHQKVRALQAGVHDYLTKPFISGELLARVNNLLENSAARKLAASEAGELPAADRMPMLSPADLAWLERLENLVRGQIGRTDLLITELSYDMNLSERQMHRRVKAVTGLTPNKYIRTIRLRVAREAIDSGRYRTLAEIAQVAGFDTPAYFARLFRGAYGRDVHDLL
ncbi:hypothetical protein C7T94_17545 [Pedobacter yulinensis]|uniref:histidine kinase n=1 Tax=Pedobacter yulinensis TaxID=2126353 RepID=A0A2T3HHT4_9SPHI|nr:ATP-binding protein [Pedobacter yulinensis]PST81990.1 hypothetical protein C7T94_17545 [Pedobacter yulinensis]